MFTNFANVVSARKLLFLFWNGARFTANVLKNIKVLKWCKDKIVELDKTLKMLFSFPISALIQPKTSFGKVVKKKLFKYYRLWCESVSMTANGRPPLSILCTVEWSSTAQYIDHAISFFLEIYTYICFPYIVYIYLFSWIFRSLTLAWRVRFGLCR